MKTTGKWLVVLLLPLLILGCSVLDKGYNKQVVYTPVSTNVITKYVTNTVVIPAITNADNTVTPPKIIQSTTPVIEYVITPASYSTNFVDKPEVVGTIQAVEAFPVPFAGLIGAVIGLFYTTYKMIRNKQGLAAVVTGIDEGRKILQTTPELQAIDAKIKDILIKHQEVAGVLNLVSDTVNKYTGDTVPPKP